MSLKGSTIALSLLLLGTSGSFTVTTWAKTLTPPLLSQDRDDWAAPPAELTEVERQGFHDGVEGARKDVENHRAPNVNNRDEYRHPHVEARDRHAYREGFRRGYDTAMRHLMEHH